MSQTVRTAVALALAAAIAACATTPRPDTHTLAPAATDSAPDKLALDPRIADRILALDPERVIDSDVRDVLAKGPTPRIISLHGGIYPVHLVMQSFASFLVGMGYPEGKIRHPGDGRLSHSPYEDSTQIAGAIAWYYEREGMMPMLIGHSQGGIQLVKVLHELAGHNAPSVRVWNPLTDSPENRDTIRDPYSGVERPVLGLTIPYASAVGAGGAGLILPNQWSMTTRLRSIPDSVEEFTGYSLQLDLIAWDFPGTASTYRPNGLARVRNVVVPSASHITLPATAHLAQDPAMREWINSYTPGRVNGFPANARSSEGALWAADVWHSIKKHWVLEAQKVVRASRGPPNEE